MLIWINGPFGVGKTTVARRLVKCLDGVRLVDPEQIGFMLRQVWTAPDVPDFQDLPVWRQLTIDLLVAAEADGRTIVVPMSLGNPLYFEEIVGGLRRRGVDVHHFTLMAPAAKVRRRIWRRVSGLRSKRWELARVSPGLASFADPVFAVHLDAARRKPTEIARDILACIADGRSAAA